MEPMNASPQPMNFLARLKSMVSPTSTAGQLGNQDAYARHVQQSIEAGQQPMNRMEFLQAMQNDPNFAAQFTGQ
jgi:hypothetical protein